MADSLFANDIAQRCTVAHSADRRVLALARTMKIQVPDAIGIVEAIRLWVAAYIPKMNIGKYDNQAIADSIFYGANPDRMISALCEVGWIRTDPKDRLVLVGWSWKKETNVSRRRLRLRIAGGDVTADMRRFIYNRDRNMCRFCSSGEDLTIDHVIAVANGGKTERTNLQTLCRPCNSRKRDS